MKFSLKVHLMAPHLPVLLMVRIVVWLPGCMSGGKDGFGNMMTKKRSCGGLSNNSDDNMEMTAYVTTFSGCVLLV